MHPVRFGQIFNFFGPTAYDDSQKFAKKQGLGEFESYNWLNHGIPNNGTNTNAMTLLTGDDMTFYRQQEETLRKTDIFQKGPVNQQTYHLDHLNRCKVASSGPGQVSTRLHKALQHAYSFAHHAFLVEGDTLTPMPIVMYRNKPTAEELQRYAAYNQAAAAQRDKADA